MITKFDTFINESLDNLSIEDTIKAIKKDKILKPLFKSDIPIENMEVFYDTLNYLFYNNRSILEYFKNDGQFSIMRNKKLSDYTDNINYILENTKELISDITKNINKKVNTKLSAAAKKEILNFANSYGYRNFDRYIVNELKNLPNLRPDKNVVLYRGMLFKKYSLEKSYNNELGLGLKFLNNIKQGTDIVNITFDKVSSWTYDISVAENFAKYSEQASQNSAMLNWLHRSKEKREIDGELGVIISVIAKPENIIIDLTKINIDEIGYFKHGSESECLLDIGNYLCRIVKAYNKQGEIDIKNFFNQDNNEDIKKYSEIYSEIKKIIDNMNIDFDNILSTDGGVLTSRNYNDTNIDTIKKLLINYESLNNSLTPYINQITEIFKDFKQIEDSTILDEKNKNLIKYLNIVYKYVSRLEYDEKKNTDIVKYADKFYTSRQSEKYFSKKLGKEINFNRYKHDKLIQFKEELSKDLGFNNYYELIIELKKIFILINTTYNLYYIKEYVEKINNINEVS